MTTPEGEPDIEIKSISPQERRGIIYKILEYVGLLNLLARLGFLKKSRQVISATLIDPVDDEADLRARELARRHDLAADSAIATAKGFERTGVACNRAVEGIMGLVRTATQGEPE